MTLMSMALNVLDLHDAASSCDAKGTLSIWKVTDKIALTTYKYRSSSRTLSHVGHFLREKQRDGRVEKCRIVND